MAGTGDKLLTAAEIKEVTDTKVNISDIVNALNSTSTNKPLSAAQGKVLNDAIAQSTAIKTETVTVSASGEWINITGIQVDVDRVFKVEMDGRWVLWRKRGNNHQITMLRINTSGSALVIDSSEATITVTLYYI